MLRHPELRTRHLDEVAVRPRSARRHPAGHDVPPMFLQRVGIFTTESYISKWKIACFIIHVFAGIMVPSADIVSMEALALRQCLAAGSQGIARRFFRAACPLIDIPWQIAVGSDLQHPEVEGKRPAQVRFVNWYLEKLFRAAQHDGRLATSFLEVANHPQQTGSCWSPILCVALIG